MVCPAQNFLSGAIFYNTPINLAVCNKWSAEFDFRIFDGDMADGLAFCFLDVPPTGFVTGGGMGIPATANGLKVCFDPNPNCAPYDPSVMPKIEIRWGQGYDECTAQPTVSNVNGSLSFIRSDTYNHAKITYDTGNISVYVNNQLYLTAYQQFTFAGYMGFTASTGGRTDNHSITNVTVYTDMPPSVAGTSQTACSGSGVQLGSAPNAAYAYAWSPSTGLSATNIANPVATLTNNSDTTLIQTYYVLTSFSNNTGCASLDNVTVTVPPQPAVNVTATETEICAGTPVTFTAAVTNAAPAATYLWYKNGVSTGVSTATYSSTTFNNNDQVYCSVTSQNCTATSNITTLNVLPVITPSISITASLLTICPGTAITFTATAVGGGIAPQYQWTINGAPTGQGLSTFTTASLNNNDVVACRLTSNAVCVVPATANSNSFKINVNSVVAPLAVVMGPVRAVCKGTEVGLQVVVTNATAISYQWTVNGVNAGTDSTLTSTSFLDGDDVSCVVTVKTPCSTGTPISGGDVIIRVIPSENATVSITASNLNVCTGTPVTFTAVAANSGSSPVYQWMVNGIKAGENSTVFTSSTLQNNDVVTCQVTLQAVTCLVNYTPLSNALTVQVFALPTVNLPASATITAGDNITLQPTVTGDVVTYSWTPTTGLSNATAANPLASPLSNTTYTLTVTTSGGCTATASTQVKVLTKIIVIHNTFTPNADGKNDTWVIDDLDNYPLCTVDIFTRYGQKIFHSNGYATPWDGSFNNKALPFGVYYYVINLKNDTPILAGYVTIVK